MALPYETLILGAFIGNLIFITIELFVLVNIARFRGSFMSFISTFQDPEQQMTTLKSLGRGLGMGLLEYMGAKKGGEVRAQNAEVTRELLQNGNIQDLISMGLGGLKGSIKIGGFSIPKADAAQFAMGLLGKMGQGQGGGFLGQQGSSGNNQGGLP